jgi:hypothetical protein
MKYPLVYFRSFCISIVNVNANANANAQYSGGQAIHGQGGYYGSGGARRECPSKYSPASWKRPSMLASQEDVLKVSKVMEEVKRLHERLQVEVDSHQDKNDHPREDPSNTGAGTSSKIHEIKTCIKKICSQPDITETLNRLELNGEPVWGLSTEERDLVVTCRMQSK